MNNVGANMLKQHPDNSTAQAIVKCVGQIRGKHSNQGGAANVMVVYIQDFKRLQVDVVFFVCLLFTQCRILLGKCRNSSTSYSI